MAELCGVRFIAPVFDTSGYAQASRSNILSLYKKGVDISVKPFCFEKNRGALGNSEELEIINDLVRKSETTADFDIVICQLTPDMAVLNRIPGKYNIAYFAWETTRVHQKWVQCLNEMSEVWVPSAFNVDALRESGVRVPVLKVPHGIDKKPNDEDLVDKIPITIDDDTFYFYSVFQWQPRKNPESLLRSYFSTFDGNDKVALVLKTYIREGGDSEASAIASRILDIKRDMMLDNYPRVLLISSILSEEQMWALHLGMDCCVSLHRSEGFGLPLMEAGRAGNPVIATGGTGNLEFMNNDNSFLVNTSWSYVREMSSFNSWYVGNGMWCSPDEADASKFMRYVYENKDEAKKKGLLLKENIVNNFNYDKISDIMLNRLHIISKRL